MEVAVLGIHRTKDMAEEEDGYVTCIRAIKQTIYVVPL